MVGQLIPTKQTETPGWAEVAKRKPKTKVPVTAANGTPA